MIKVPVTPAAYCYDAEGKKQVQLAVKRFYRAAAKQLPEFTFKVHFNPGGIAVWGETYAKVYRAGVPVVEAWNVDGAHTSGRMLVRQWDGRNSGHNTYASTMADFTDTVRKLAAAPFRRF